MENQIEALEHYGVSRDMIYTDKMTGGTMKRPGLQKALRMALMLKADFCVWKLDRLGRTTMGILSTVQLFEDNEVTLISVTEPLDLSTPTGKLLVTQLASFAELERNLIQERTMRGLEQARAEGRIPGRPESMTEERKARAIEMLGAGATIKAILAELKTMPGPTIGRTKVYNWVKDYRMLHPEDPTDDR
ncbi:MAG: recombinase family protein [Cognatishimia sp.]